MRLLGITGYWPGLLVSIAQQVKVDTILNYCHSNLLMRDMSEELVPFARSEGIGLINASPLHMGLLGGAPVPEWHPAPQEVKRAAIEMQRSCRAFGLNPAAVAQAWCLAQPEVATTLVGIRSVEELEAALSALQLEIPEELGDQIGRIAATVAHASWPSGLPENQPSSVLHAG